MNAVPIGGKLVAPAWLVGLFVFVDLINFVIIPFLYLSLQKYFHLGCKSAPVFGYSIAVVSVNLFYQI